jgi:hypothetical protein
MAASVQHELTRMRMILQELEERLDAGEVPPEGLPEFKEHRGRDPPTRVGAAHRGGEARGKPPSASGCGELPVLPQSDQELSAGQVSAGHRNGPRCNRWRRS